MKRMAGRAFAACVIAACAFAASATTTAQAAAPQAEPGLGAAQIIEKNAAARGGVDAWRKVLTMAWSGRVETGNAARPTMPFVLEQKRPDKTRFEITFDQQKSLRIFDGTEGWKLRPSSSGRPETVAYTADEASYAREAQVVDGPLMDCAAKGYPVT